MPAQIVISLYAHNASDAYTLPVIRCNFRCCMTNTVRGITGGDLLAQEQVILLDERGKDISSEDMANLIAQVTKP